MRRAAIDGTTDSNGILRACGPKPWEIEKDGILRLAYCLTYCLFWSPNRGYLRDSIDWIETILGT
jgi:hypothetical protein